MSKVQEMVDALERDYTRRDEAAIAPRAKAPAPARRRAPKGEDAEGLADIERTLHPLCVNCGQRIEVDRLQANAEEHYCNRCVAEGCTS